MTGTSFVAIGLVIAANSESASNFVSGSAAYVVGSLLIFVGVPTILVGVVRHGKLRKNQHYKTLNTRTLNISPTINRNQFNNTYSLGLVASLRF